MKKKNETKSSVHFFNVKNAEKFGLVEAILIQNLSFWIEHNQANEENFIEGRTWTYNSVKAFTQIFPYLSTKLIRTALDHLIKEGVLLSGCFNKKGYDRTTWWAFTDQWNSGQFDLDNAKTNEFPICPPGQIDLPPGANAFAPQGEPIPDRIKDRIEDGIDSESDSDQVEENELEFEAISEQERESIKKEIDSESESIPVVAKPKNKILDLVEGTNKWNYLKDKCSMIDFDLELNKWLKAVEEKNYRTLKFEPLIIWLEKWMNNAIEYKNKAFNKSDSESTSNLLKGKPSTEEYISLSTVQKEDFAKLVETSPYKKDLFAYSAFFRSNFKTNIQASEILFIVQQLIDDGMTLEQINIGLIKIGKYKDSDKKITLNLGKLKRFLKQSLQEQELELNIESFNE